MLLGVLPHSCELPSTKILIHKRRRGGTHFEYRIGYCISNVYSRKTISDSRKVEYLILSFYERGGAFKAIHFLYRKKDAGC